MTNTKKKGPSITKADFDTCIGVISAVYTAAENMHDPEAELQPAQVRVLLRKIRVTQELARVKFDEILENLRRVNGADFLPDVAYFRSPREKKQKEIVEEAPDFLS